jgi:formate dehydrogenase subunit delta
VDLRKLVRMANQIGAFFASEPDHKAAVEGVANHIRRFWEPRMRAQLLDGFDRGECKDALPLVVDAVREHRDRLLAGTAQGAGSHG